jgi:hypothetical protein
MLKRNGRLVSTFSFVFRISTACAKWRRSVSNSASSMPVTFLVPARSYMRASQARGMK